MSTSSGSFLRAHKRWSLPLGIIIASVVAVTLLASFSPAPEKKVAPPKPMAVSALEVAKEDITVTVQSQGRVTPRISTVLTSEVSGAVIEVSEHFVNGGFVQQGQLLLKFDDRNYRAAVMRAEADVARFNTALIQEKGQAQVAYSQWKKSKDVKRSEEALSLLLRRPQMKEAEANLAFAKAELEKAKGELEKTEIRAPFDGLIKQKYIDIAQYATPGSRLADLVAVDYAEVRLAIPQDRLAYMNLPGITPGSSDREAMTAVDASELKESVPVILKSSLGSSELQWKAQIVRTEGLFDEKNHTLYAVAHIKDPYLLNTDGQPSENQAPLLMGTYVEAFIRGHRMQGLVRIPRHALRAGDVVWVVDQNNQLRNRKLDVLRIGGDQVYVTAGLEDGERVCLTHVGEIVPGTPVQVAELLHPQETRTAMLYE